MGDSMPPHDATALGAVARAALESTSFWTISTVGADGAPQATIVWVDHRDGLILVNSAVGRVKARNLERDGRVALTWVDPLDSFAFVSIKGRVVRSYVGVEALRDIDALAQKYTGADYPMLEQAQTRISYLIAPTSVWERTRPDRG